MSFKFTGNITRVINLQIRIVETCTLMSMFPKILFSECMVKDKMRKPNICFLNTNIRGD
jgi:hypothetical protein